MKARAAGAVLSLALLVSLALAVSACSGSTKADTQSGEEPGQADVLLPNGDIGPAATAEAVIDAEGAALLANEAENHLAARRYADALRAMNEAIALNPNVESYYETRMRIYGFLLDGEHALEDVNTLLDFRPDDAMLYVTRGTILADLLGRRDEARADYDHALELEPDQADAFYNRGRLEFFLGRDLQALADFNRAIELSLGPGMESFAYHERGRVQIDIHNYVEGLADINHAIALRPDWPGFYANRALAYAKLGMTADAIADLDHFFTFESDNPDVVQMARDLLIELRGY